MKYKIIFVSLLILGITTLVSANSVKGSQFSTSYPGGVSGTSITGPAGMTLVPENNISTLEVRIASDRNCIDFARIENEDNSTVLETKNNVCDGEKLNFSQKLQVGTTYKVYMENSDSGDGFGYGTDGTVTVDYPTEYNDFKITGSIKEDSYEAFDRITAYKKDSSPKIESVVRKPQNYVFGDSPNFSVNATLNDTIRGNDGKFSGETFHHGSINGASWTSGRYGEALSFDGDADYVDVGSGDFLDSSDNVAFCSWSNPKGTSIDGNPGGIINQKNKFEFRFDGIDNSKLVLNVFNGTDNDFNRWDLGKNNPYGHYCGSYNFDTGVANAYVNGTDLGNPDFNQDAVTGNLANTNNNLYIGTRKGSGAYEFNGTLENVQIYNRSLSSSEVSSIYNDNKFIREDLEAFWRMDSGSGGTAFDTHHRVSRFNNNSIFGGAVSFDGTDDLVNADSPVSTSSVAMWVKTSATPGGAWEYLFDGRKSNADPEADSYIANNGIGSFWTEMYVNGNKQSSVDWDNIPKGEWAHVYFKGTGSFKDDITIGAKDPEFSSLQSLTGLIDDVCVWNRSISSSEISIVKKGGCMSVQEGLVTSYQFENATERPESRGTNILDYSVVPKVTVDVLRDSTQIVDKAFMEVQNWWDWNSVLEYEIKDVFTVDEAGLYNATLNAIDKAGLTSSTSISQTVSDSNPVISLNRPSGEKFDYDLTYEVTTSKDNDDVLNEDIQCTVSDGEGTVDTFTVQEGTDKTGSFRRDTGSYTLTASCTEQKGDGNTASDTTNYNVKEFKINSVSSQSTVYETENIAYTLDYRTGDMVNQFTGDLNLTWNGTTKTFSFATTGSEDSVETVTRKVPLVQNNDTAYNWDLKAEYNTTNFNGGTELSSKTSSLQTQTVLHNYYFDKHSLKNGFTQLEASSLNYTSSIVEEKESTARLDVTHSFNQTETSKTGKENNKTSYYNVFDSNLVNDVSETFKLSADYTISFENYSRTFADSTDVQLDKIILNKSNTGPETLKFETRDETNNTLVDADVAAGIEVNNPDQPDKTRFYGFDFSKDQTHSVYLQPSYGEINANIFEKRSVEYSNTDKNYPERRYYLTDTLLNNETTNINLYLLKQSLGSTVRLELLNNDLKPLESHLIRVERAFPDKDETRTVALAKTGGDGFASSFLKLQEQYIFTIFNNEGELIDQIGPQSITSTRETLEVEDDIPPSFAKSTQQVKFTEIQEKENGLSVFYISETDRLNNIYLSVYQDDLFSTQIISSDSSEQVQGRLEASGFNASNERVFYELVGTFGETNITLQTGVYGEQSNNYGEAGIFVSFMMFMALTLSGLFRPSAAIGLGVVSIFVMAFTGLLPVGQTALISLAALAAVLIWRMSS